MKNGDKMDFGKITDILGTLYDEREVFIESYLPSDYYLNFDDALTLSSFVASGWAELTDEGKLQIEIAWGVLCDLHGLDREKMYDSPVAFFRAQEIGEEEPKNYDNVIPLRRD